MTQPQLQADRVCGFRYTRAAWGEFSNFWPLPSPIDAGPWRFRTSEALYQAAKFPHRPDVQARIARAPTTRAAKTIGRSHPIQLDWNTQRVNAMRWVLRMKYESNAPRIDEVLARTGERPVGRSLRPRPLLGGAAHWRVLPRPQRARAGCGWNCASRFATPTPRPVPTPGSAAPTLGACPANPESECGRAVFG